jgi:hypothetical protein
LSVSIAAENPPLEVSFKSGAIMAGKKSKGNGQKLTEAGSALASAPAGF